MFLSERDRRYLDSLIQVDVNQELQWEGKRWVLTINPLAIEDSITSKLGTTDNPRVEDSISLDWHDIFDRPNQARMHMFVGADRQVPFEVKLERMETWTEAVKIYNCLMVDGITKLSKEEVEELLGNGLFPRLETVVLATGRRGLRMLLSRLGFKVENKSPFPFVPNWQDLVEVAKSGQLIDEWKALKGR